MPTERERIDGGNSPADLPSPRVLHNSADQILTHVLSSPMSTSEYMKRKLGTHGAITVDIDRYWNRLQGASGLHSILRGAVTKPVFIPSADPTDFVRFEDFDAAIRLEMQSRLDQRHYYRVFEGLLTEVEDPSQLIKLVHVYGFLQEHTKGDEVSLPPETFARRLIQRGTDLVTDPIDGDANPMTAARVAFPAVRLLLDLQPSLRPQEDPEQIGVGFARHVMSIAPGTADRIAGIHVRQMLRDEGYAGFEDTQLSAKRAREVDPNARYISSSTIQVLRDNGIFHAPRLPEGGKAIEVLAVQILDILKDLPERGLPNAEMILRGFKTLQERHGTDLGSMATINDLIHLSNIIIPQISRWGILIGEAELVEFDRNEIKDVPLALQRVLFAIDPSILKEAMETPLADKSDLRMRMVYINALMNQIADYRKVQVGPPIGDFVLRLISIGYDPDRVAEKLQQIMAEPDDRARNLIEDTFLDSRIRSNVSRFRLKRPGRDLLS